jgi:hypothetical protein
MSFRFKSRLAGKSPEEQEAILRRDEEELKAKRKEDELKGKVARNRSVTPVPQRVRRGSRSYKPPSKQPIPKSEIAKEVGKVADEIMIMYRLCNWYVELDNGLSVFPDEVDEDGNVYVGVVPFDAKGLAEE